MNSVLPADYRAHPTVNRKFWAILALSVLLHGSLFALTVWQRQIHRAAPLPLLVNLRLMPAADRTPAPPQQPVALSKAAARPNVVRQALPTTPIAAPAAVATVPGAAVVADATPSEPVRMPANVAPGAEPQRPLPAPSAVNVNALAAYRRQLAELFARVPDYPRIAAMRGWEGEVRLRLKVARKGNLIAVVLDRSSGFEVLDQHALAMLEGHGSLPPLPDALESSEIQVVVPIQYKLKKAT